MAKKEKKIKNVQKPFLSDRQKKVFLIAVLMIIIAVPMINTLRCKAKCLKRIKTPYPEIACQYECPWFWKRK